MNDWLYEIVLDQLLQDMSVLPQEDRLALFNAMKRAYCQHCGVEILDRQCHCEDEE